MARFGIVAAPAASPARRQASKIEVDQVVTCERTFTMRYLLLSSALLLVGTATAALAEEPKRFVYLDSVVLEQIKKTQSGPLRPDSRA